MSIGHWFKMRPQKTQTNTIHCNGQWHVIRHDCDSGMDVTTSHTVGRMGWQGLQQPRTKTDWRCIYGRMKLGIIQGIIVNRVHFDIMRSKVGWTIFKFKHTGNDQRSLPCKHGLLWQIIRRMPNKCQSRQGTHLLMWMKAIMMERKRKEKMMCSQAEEHYI